MLADKWIEVESDNSEHNGNGIIDSYVGEEEMEEKYLGANF